MSYASLDHYVFDTIEHLIVVDTNFLEMLFQLIQIPLRSVFGITLSFHVVIGPFID